jgi:hypothetical protein
LKFLGGNIQRLTFNLQHRMENFENMPFSAAAACDRRRFSGEAVFFRRTQSAATGLK